MGTFREPVANSLLAYWGYAVQAHALYHEF